MEKKAKKKPSKLPIELTRLLKKGDISTYEDYYLSPATKAIRMLIVEELDKQIELSVLASDKKDKYQSPSWAELQADSIGYRRSLRQLKKLLTKE